MAGTIRVVLLYGGQSGEHEISLKSAASVLKHLDSSKYQITPVGMDKQGRCFIHSFDALSHHTESLPVFTDGAIPLPSLIQDGSLAIDADVVFPVVHGPLYEDGCLQGLLTLANAAFVGCDTLSSALSMDKDIARRLVSQNGVESAMYHMVRSNLPEDTLDDLCNQIFDKFKTPVFVKPCSMGSSVGIHKVEHLSELKPAIIDAGRFDTEVIIEEFIDGREIELAVLEALHPNDAPLVTIPGEVRVNHKDGFYSYTAKYLESDQTELSIPAELSDSVRDRLKEQAQIVFSTLKCRGMSRVDFFYQEQEDKIYFNEINTIPGFTTISMYAKLWQHEGLSFTLLLDKLIQLAMQRHQLENQLLTHYQ